MIRKNNEGINEIALINIFASIQGEGYAAGKPTVFIRTFGCNLRCVFCDTKECWSKENMLKVYPERKDWEDPFRWLTAKQIFNLVEEIEKDYIHKSICLTGGEPLMEENKEFMLNELLPLFDDLLAFLLTVALVLDLLLVGVSYKPADEYLTSSYG